MTTVATPCPLGCSSRIAPANARVAGQFERINLGDGLFVGGAAGLDAHGYGDRVSRHDRLGGDDPFFDAGGFGDLFPHVRLVAAGGGVMGGEVGADACLPASRMSSAYTTSIGMAVTTPAMTCRSVDPSQIDTSNVRTCVA